MRLELVYFSSLLFTALSLAPGLAHLFALPNKIHLDANDYLTVQLIYRGWAFLGILLLLALASNLILAIMTRNGKPYFILNGIAFVCMLLNLIIFFAFTFPANRQTSNWTMLPDHWKQLRVQWEYSHAVNACLSFIALIMLIISVLKGMSSRLSININH